MGKIASEKGLGVHGGRAYLLMLGKDEEGFHKLYGGRSREREEDVAELDEEFLGLGKGGRELSLRAEIGLEEAQEALKEKAGETLEKEEAPQVLIHGPSPLVGEEGKGILVGAQHRIPYLGLGRIGMEGGPHKGIGLAEKLLVDGRYLYRGEEGDKGGPILIDAAREDVIEKAGRIAQPPQLVEKAGEQNSPAIVHEVDRDEIDSPGDGFEGVFGEKGVIVAP